MVIACSCNWTLLLSLSCGESLVIASSVINSSPCTLLECPIGTLHLQKHNAVAVVIDALTKYVILLPCSKDSSGADWAHMFVDVHEHFGLPVHVLPAGS